ncbi:MAG TPA: tetratricopeptide repeat protein [Bryobacteraceae bacterium]|nr:tetratricopeptide repeat protein [Bryobacteraceae bacterium]
MPQCLFFRRQSQPFAHLASILALAAFAVVAPNQCPAQDNDAVLKLYQAAKTAEQNGAYPQATQSYERILALRPDLAEAHANLGNLYYIQSKYDQAERAFRTALKLKPQLAGPQFFLGVLSFRSRDWTAAINHLNKAAELNPTNPLIQLQLGYTYYAKGDFANAVNNLEKVVRVDERNEDAWYHLSKLHGQLSRRYFDELQLTAADSFYTHLARAHFYEGQASWQEAALEYEKADKSKPTPELKTKLHYLAARAEGKQADWKPTTEALDGSTQFLHQPPDIGKVLSEFWRLRQGLKEVEPLKASPEQLYKLAENHQLLSYMAALWVYGTNSDSYRAHQLKGQSLEAAGRNEEAIAEYRAALAKKPDLQTVHFAIGNILWRSGQLEEALPELKAELEISPNDPQAHYELGDILLIQGNLDAAIGHYLSCLRFAPETSEAHLALDRIYTSKGQTAEAMQHLRKAAAIAPNDPTPHYRLWLLYRKQGNTAEAAKSRKKFEELKKSAKPSTEGAP